MELVTEEASKTPKGRHEQPPTASPPHPVLSVSLKATGPHWALTLADLPRQPLYRDVGSASVILMLGAYFDVIKM